MASQFQNLKNFIRHGKHARNNQDGTSHPPQQQHALSDPTGKVEPQKQYHQKQDFSVAPVDNRNVVAQANNAAANATGAQQKLHINDPNTVHSPKGGVSAGGIGGQGGKAYDETVLARIVAEEKESRERLPRYPGLERWILLEKMGDGAFSNVYRARDSTGEFDQVAIKVVRKYELNAAQVCTYHFLLFCSSNISLPSLFSFSRSQGGLKLSEWGLFWEPFDQHLGDFFLRVMTIFMRTSRRCQKQLRCARFLKCLLSTKISLAHYPLPFPEKNTILVVFPIIVFFYLYQDFLASFMFLHILDSQYPKDCLDCELTYFIASKYPQRSTNNARSSTREHRLPDFIFGISELLLSNLGALLRWRIIPPNCASHLLFRESE